MCWIFRADLVMKKLPNINDRRKRNNNVEIICINKIVQLVIKEIALNKREIQFASSYTNTLKT